MHTRKQLRRDRRGAVLVLSAFFMVVLLGMIAFAVDSGYIVLGRTQLQVAADSAAMAAAANMGDTPAEIRAAAKQYAGYHKAAGATVNIADSDVEFGTWDASTRAFTTTGGVGNAVRITARRDNATLFFAKIFGKDSVSLSASAIAMVAPRDIAFVVDLSGSMNDDTEPCWATQAIDSHFTSQGYGNVAEDLMANLYTDFNFGTFPGTLQHVGQAWVTADAYAFANLTKNGGPLTGSSIASTYKISNTTSETDRKTKGYRWLIDNQIAQIMPQARPTPSSSTNYAYWERYLDYVIQPQSVSSSGQGTPRNGYTGTVPNSQASTRITGMGNPNVDGYTWADQNAPEGFRNKIGYRTYVQFMMDHGRDLAVTGSTYTPLSISSPHCPYHNEVTAGGTFSFPPREQPTHSTRRALIAALKVIKDRNASIPDMDERDQVSIITFDHLNSGGAVVRLPLTGNYDTAMQSCTTMQCVSDSTYSTATESGMAVAQQHLLPSGSGGSGRSFANKVVVVVTDGSPNLHVTPSEDITTYMTAHSNSDYYASGSTNAPKNGPLMQAAEMQAEHWQVYPVGLGLGTNYDFMDRMARMGDTANDDGQSARGSGNPAEYEARMEDIFDDIIASPRQRLVQ